MTPFPSAGYSQRVREQGRMKAVLITIDLLLRYKPMDDEYVRSLLWIRHRLEKNLKAEGVTGC